MVYYIFEVTRKVEYTFNLAITLKTPDFYVMVLVLITFFVVEKHFFGCITVHVLLCVLVLKK